MTPEASLLPAGSSHRLSGVQPVPRLFPSGCYLNGLQGDSRVGWDLTGVKVEKNASLPPLHLCMYLNMFPQKRELCSHLEGAVLQTTCQVNSGWGTTCQCTFPVVESTLLSSQVHYNIYILTCTTTTTTKPKYFVFVQKMAGCSCLVETLLASWGWESSL